MNIAQKRRAGRDACGRRQGKNGADIERTSGQQQLNYLEAVLLLSSASSLTLNL